MISDPAKAREIRPAPANPVLDGLLTLTSARVLPLPSGGSYSGYAGDLLSWVMGRAKADDVWLTVMGNINAIAVATLADVSAIVLVEDAALDAEALARANQQEVAVYTTSLPAYETALQIAAALEA